jgi:hypothetical protein
MTATVPEQLRTFHITGHGLEADVPTLHFADVANGRALAGEEQFYPIILTPGSVANFDADAAMTLAVHALLTARAAARAAFTEKLRQTAERLEDLLALDDSHGEDAVAPGSLGNVAGQYLNVASLSAALRRRTNPVHRMAPERRGRCEHALAAMRQALAVVHPPVTIYHVEPVGNPFGGEMHHSSDPCAAALAHVRSQLTAMQGTLRALRMARLELDDAYDPAVHDSILHRFRWEAAEPSELAAQAPVVAVLTTAQASALPLQSLTHLLRSGAPVTVILTQAGLGGEDIHLTAAEFAQMAIAHRDAFVLQGSLARPDHLQRGLAELAQTLGPGIAVVATAGPGAWAEAALLVLSKAWPLFTFNPKRSVQWRECFELEPVEANPWTAAHAAACSAALRQHFRLLPEGTDEHDPVELDRYLAEFHERAPLAVPYLTVAGEKRVAVSRDLADYCHDLLQAYTVLEQWTQKPVAVAAAEPVSSDVKQQAMRQGAELAVARVVALLTGA